MSARKDPLTSKGSAFSNLRETSLDERTAVSDFLGEIVFLKRKFAEFENRLSRFDDSRKGFEIHLEKLTETSQSGLEYLAADVRDF